MLKTKILVISASPLKPAKTQFPERKTERVRRRTGKTPHSFIEQLWLRDAANNAEL